MTLTRLHRLIINHLTTIGPARFCDLAMVIAVRPDTLNRSIAGLLEAGMIERCEVGQAGGVRLVNNKESEG